MKKVKINEKEYALTEDPITVAYIDSISSDSVCDSCYGEIYDGDELVTGSCVNPENSQRINPYALMHTECKEDVPFEMEIELTDGHYDWTSETANMFNRMIDAKDENERDEIADEYHKAMSAYTHTCRDVVSEVEERITEARAEAEARV